MLRPNQPSQNSALLLQGTETREAKMQISRSTEKDNQGRLKAHHGAGKEVARGGTEVERSLDKFFSGEDAQAGGVVGSEVRRGLSACATVAKPAGGQQCRTAASCNAASPSPELTAAVHKPGHGHPEHDRPGFLPM